MWIYPKALAKVINVFFAKYISKQRFLEVFWREECFIRDYFLHKFVYVSHDKKNNKSLNQNSEYSMYSRAILGE